MQGFFFPPKTTGKNFKFECVDVWRMCGRCVDVWKMCAPKTAGKNFRFGCVDVWQQMCCYLRIYTQNIPGCATDVSVDAHLFERIYANCAWMCGGCANECAYRWEYIRKMVHRCATDASIDGICLYKKFPDVRRMFQWMRICLSAYTRILPGCGADVPMNAHVVGHIYAKCASMCGGCANECASVWAYEAA